MKRLAPILTTIALVLTIAWAAGPPLMKEGLWSVRTQSVDEPGAKKTEGAYSLCRDHAFDLAVREKAKKVPGCTVVNENFDGSKLTAQIHCVQGGSTIESKTVTTFQGDTEVHSDSHSTMDPPLYGTKESTMAMDQKYVGACPANAKPGDRINKDGSIMHLRR